MQSATGMLNRLKILLDSTNNAIIEVDIRGLIVTVNRAMEKVLAKPAAEVLGQPIQEVIPNTGLMEVLQTGQPQIGQRFTLGHSTYVTNRTPVYHDNQLVGAVAVLQDITELQQALAELDDIKDLTELLKTVLDVAYDGIVVVDDQARITMFNRAYCEFLGVKEEDVLGRQVQDVIENTRMHIVVRTGEAEIGCVQRIRGHDMVCSRIPLKRNGKVWAAVGKVMFRDVQDLRSLLERVNRLQNELEYYKGELKRHQGTKFCLDNIIGTSPQIVELKNLVQKVARSRSTVLIRGESGTGKELFAHAIHNASPWYLGPFVKVNCAAVPENLLESELFGYQEGAFTGARKGGKIGKFELADGGTIFLDEIGDLPLNMQAKLLRVLQEKEFERLGDNRTIKTDVRVVAATNRNLEKMVREGQFREDLFYRLNVVVIEVPPLRNRKEDIAPLVADFLHRIARRMGRPRPEISTAAMELIERHDWPGNIRELENVLERALNIMDGNVIHEDHLPYYLQQEREGQNRGCDIPPLKEAVRSLEADLIRRALEAAGGDALAAAKILGIGKSAFYDKMTKYGISI